ncbi:MAG: hypothetical protein AABW46_03615 [Nanoarchaeota archaeon]
MGGQEYVVGTSKFYGAEIRKKGVLDPRRLHKEVVPWFFDHKYFFSELNITNKDLSSGKEIKIEWDAWRKIDDYFRFHMEVLILVWRFREDKGETTIQFKGYLEKDYSEKFVNRYAKRFGSIGRTFGNWLRKIYEMYVIQDKIEKMKGKVWVETNEMIDEFKKVLGLIVK